MVEMAHFRPLLFLGGETGGALHCDHLRAMVDVADVSESVCDVTRGILKLAVEAV